MARLALVLVLLGGPAGLVHAADTTAWPTMIVRVFPYSASQDELTTARDVAESILVAAGVGISWVECRPGSPDSLPPKCGRPLDRRELVVRVAAATGSGATGSPGALGFSLIDRQAAAGTVATIYTDRVASLATIAGVDCGSLLGRAIAHEIGHLLLGTNQHAKRGLMRAKWSNLDLRRGRPVDWLFSREDALALRRAALERRP